MLEGAKAMEAVLDIGFPFLTGGQQPPRDLGRYYVYQMPLTTAFVCIAAFFILHRNIRR